ncbi:WecB/TagA/CpsF family glycosyltransferase [Methylomonas sp. AM2-LC]|uniref:WecB/TagA/CpsF family glycosyltransferase n=1 Tax=Methylomonas sp. AM2-LC TaxID=3153301 RepID=UPI003265AA53
MNITHKIASAPILLPSVFTYLSLLNYQKSVEDTQAENLAATDLSLAVDNDIDAVQLYMANDSLFDSLKQVSAIEKLINIFGIKFPALNYEKALDIFQKWIEAKTVNQVCIVNVHTLVNSLKDKELESICNNAMSTMDGVPLVWYSNLIANAGLDTNVCGPDLMLKCIDEGRDKGWKHYFLGSTDEVLHDLVDVMHNRYPGADIVGWYSPPFRSLSDQEDQQIVDLINVAEPHFLWVSLGAPKQEKWIAHHLHRINVPVQLGVGAAFSFHSGHISRAPVWMQKSGFEWLYRMLKERRLFKRYLSSNPVFLAIFIKDFVSSKIKRFSL